jgi:hypothetical protein
LGQWHLTHDAPLQTCRMDKQKPSCKIWTILG